MFYCNVSNFATSMSGGPLHLVSIFEACYGLGEAKTKQNIILSTFIDCIFGFLLLSSCVALMAVSMLQFNCLFLCLCSVSSGIKLYLSSFVDCIGAKPAQNFVFLGGWGPSSRGFFVMVAWSCVILVL